MKAHRAIKYVRAAVYSSLVILAISAISMLYWLYQPSNVLEFNQQPIPARIDGGTVILRVNYCKNLNADGRVRISFVSPSREVFLPATNDTQPAQCKDTELPILIPKDLPHDTYKIHFRIDYTINPLKHSVIEADSAKFQVIDRHNSS